MKKWFFSFMLFLTLLALPVVALLGKMNKPAAEYFLTTTKRVECRLFGLNDTVETSKSIDGKIREIKIDPTWGNAPGNNFNLYVLDDQGNDMLFGYGGGLDSASVTIMAGDSLGWLASPARLVFDNPGGESADSLGVFLWVR